MTKKESLDVFKIVTGIKNPYITDTEEAVNHPGHYNTGKLEVIDVIEDWKLNFNLGNAIKYIARADHKGNKLQDLEKALWYIQREIQRGE